jgi:E3 ubiquitin-protein ligase UBR4
MAVLVWPRNKWRARRIELLRRVVVMGQARQTKQTSQPSSDQSEAAAGPVLEYSALKPYAVFFALINGIYNVMFKVCSRIYSLSRYFLTSVFVSFTQNLKLNADSATSWSQALADFIRHNDQSLAETCEKLLREYQQEYLACQSFSEMIDVLGE